MINPPTEEELTRIPRLLETRGGKMLDKIIYEWIGYLSAQFYVAEYDPEKRKCFGYIVDIRDCFMPNLKGPGLGSGWSYFPLDPLIEGGGPGGMQVVRHIDWKERRAGDVELIVEMYRIKGIPTANGGEWDYRVH